MTFSLSEYTTHTNKTHPNNIMQTRIFKPYQNHLLIGTVCKWVALKENKPAGNWLSLPCFWAWMAIFTLLSSACWLFDQTKRGPCAIKKLEMIRILVLWNGSSLSLSLIISFPSPFQHPLCLSVLLSPSLCVSVWLSQISLVRSVFLRLTWDNNRPTRQLHVLPHCCWTGE